MLKRDSIARWAFVASCLFFAFLYGFTASRYGWFPGSLIAAAFTGMDGGGIQEKNGEGGPAEEHKSPGNPEHHKHPARHDFEGVLRHPSKAAGGSSVQDGVILLTSYWSEQHWLPGLRLIDRDGRVLHHWHVDIPRIWPTSPHRDPAAGGMNRPHNYVHGSYLFENGDVLFNVEYLGLVRMDASGKVLWRLDRRTHHSVTRTEDGNFWVCANTWRVGEAAEKYPGLRSPFSDDSALLVSPQGEILREVSVFELIYHSKHQSLLWTTQSALGRFDLLHLNDVEPLTAAMASQYPLFEAGDLLVSMRALNLVMVFSPDSGKIKWSASGQFIEQHDPDFIGNGWISVFDNRNDGSPDGRFLGGTRLVALRPHTGETRPIYPTRTRLKGERRFHTALGGKAQRLANGHWLITEAIAGRVFEVDTQGRTVWEWGHQRYKDGRISEVLEGTFYPMSPALFRRGDR